MKARATLRVADFVLALAFTSYVRRLICPATEDELERDPPCPLETMLVAELVDNDGGRLLIELTRTAGHDELAQHFRDAKTREEAHLEKVRTWIKAAAIALEKTRGRASQRLSPPSSTTTRPPHHPYANPRSRSHQLGRVLRGTPGAKGRPRSRHDVQMW